MKTGKILLVLCVIGLLSATAAVQADTFDALTGEPIPAAVRELPVTDPLQTGPPDGLLRDGLMLVAHLAEGTTKSVRTLDSSHIVFQNGAYLEFYDVSDPLAPAARARVLLAAQPSDMQLVGTVLYVALRKDQGLLVLDVSNPTAPAVLGQLTGHDLLSVAVDGSYAYCGKGSPGVVIVDVTDPAAMTVVGSFDTPGSANGTAVVGDILYVAQGNDGLGIFDLTLPTVPTPVASWPTPSFCTYVAAAADVAYLIGGFGMTLLDVADPSNPVQLSNFPTPSTCYEMELVGDEAYLAGLDGLFRISVADPAVPLELAYIYINNGLSAATTNGLAFLASRFTGLHVLTADTLDPLSRVPNAGFSNKLHLDGPLLYVVDLAGGLRIHDVSDPTAPVLLSDTETPGNSQDCAVVDGFAYVVNAGNLPDGLWNLDVTDPTVPVLLAVLDTGNMAYGIDVQSDRAYVANGFGGVFVADVADPAAPFALGSIALGANCFDVKVDGATGYTTLFGGGMASLDVTDPAAITILDQEISWGFLNALDLTPGTAWVADGQLGLRVVDITDPTNLVTLGTAPTASQARDVVWNGYVYVADDFYGLRQFDATDPTVPELVGSFPSADRGMGVDALGELVVLAAGETGVYVFQAPPVAVITGGLVARRSAGAVILDVRCNLGDAASLRIERTGESPGAARTWTAAQFEGLRRGSSGVVARVVDHHPVAGEATYRLVWQHTVLAEARLRTELPTVARLDAAPNPFNPQLQIRYALPAPDLVSVVIYDLRGRAVRKLDLGERPAGEGTVIWDGTDGTGQACASGVYHLRLRAGAQTVVRAVTLVR